MAMNIDMTIPGKASSPDRNTHQAPPSGDLRRSLINTWRNIKFLSRPLRIFLFDVVLIEGKEKYSGRRIKTLYIGETKPFSNKWGKLYTKFEAMLKVSTFQFIMDSIYSEYTKVSRAKNISGLDIHRVSQKYESQADMVFIDTESLFALPLKRSHYIVIPQLVSPRLKLADRWEAVLDSFSHKLNKKISRVLKYGYQFSPARSLHQFNYFYHSMYVPYTRKRFGKTATILSYDELKRFFDQGELFFLMRNDQVLLGTLKSFEQGCMLNICKAATGNSQPGMFKGASEAMDYYSILSAFEKGYRVVDFLWSRPFLNDGGLRYKLKWGAGIDKAHWPMTDIYFKPLRLNVGVKSFLAGNPFITKNREDFRGRVLLNTEASEMDIRNCLKYYQAKGLKGIDIFCAEGIRDGIGKKWEDRASGINIYDISASSHPHLDFCRR